MEIELKVDKERRGRVGDGDRRREGGEGNGGLEGIERK